MTPTAISLIGFTLCVIALLLAVVGCVHILRTDDSPAESTDSPTLVRFQDLTDHQLVLEGWIQEDPLTNELADRLQEFRNAAGNVHAIKAMPLDIEITSETDEEDMTGSPSDTSEVWRTEASEDWQTERADIITRLRHVDAVTDALRAELEAVAGALLVINLPTSADSVLTALETFYAALDAPYTGRAEVEASAARVASRVDPEIMNAIQGEIRVPPVSNDILETTFGPIAELVPPSPGFNPDPDVVLRRVEELTGQPLPDDHAIILIGDEHTLRANGLI
jgi:hypothetical protein